MSPLIRPTQLPCSDRAAERGVLAALMLWPERYSDITPLKHTDFAYDAHKVIYSYLQQQIQDGAPTDPVSLNIAISEGGSSKDVGGLTSLLEIVNDNPDTKALIHWASKLKELSLRRQSADTLHDMRSLILNPEGVTTSSLLYQAQEALAHLQESAKPTELYTPPNTPDERLEAILSGHTPPQAHLPTGFYDLDRILGGGLYHGDLIILAARPSHGKSALASQILLHTALKNQPVYMASFEMTMHSINLRLVAQQSQVDLKDLRRGRLKDTERQRAQDAYRRIKAAPIYISDKKTDRTLPTVIAAIKRAHRRSGGLSLAIIDYLQQIRPINVSKQYNREQEVSRVSERIQQLAGELNIPILALAQLNRECEKRQDKMPRNSDLRESGSIEQDADDIIHLMNPAKYATDDKLAPNHPQLCNLCVGKNRNGATGPFQLLFRPQYTRFENPAKEET